MRKSFLPITISELYSIPLESVERIIATKELNDDRQISDFFAMNKDKILELASTNAISSIIEEEFRDLPRIPIVLSVVQPALSSSLSDSHMSAYSSWMKQQFPLDWQDRFSSQLQPIWPKYAGSLLIEIDSFDASSNEIASGAELCLEFGEFKFNEAYNPTSNKCSFTPILQSIFILLYTKSNQYIGKIHHRFYFIWVILKKLNYACFRVFCHDKSRIRMDIYLTEKILEVQMHQVSMKSEKSQRKYKSNLNIDDQRLMTLRKYGCEAIKLTKDFLRIKETQSAQLTPIENSLNLLAQLQNRIVNHDEDTYLKSVPSRIVMRAEFLSYFNADTNGVAKIGKTKPSQGVYQKEQEADEKLSEMLRAAEKTAEVKEKMIENAMQDDESGGNDEGDGNEEEKEVEDDEQIQNDNYNNDDVENIVDDDQAENAGETAENANEIGQLLGVNAERVSDSFVLSTPPSADFTTTLFDFQKQALTWMLYKESAIPLSEAMSKNKSWPVFEREMDVFWSELVLLDGSVIYFNEYGQVASKDFPRAAKSLHSGGILADEMGLGKTIMAMSLIASNRPKVDHRKNAIEVNIEPDTLMKRLKGNPSSASHSKSKAMMREEAGQMGLIRAGTLIVLPLSVLNQWVGEIEKHFRKEAVYYLEYYDEKRRNQPQLHLYDIVLTTYNILAIEYKNAFVNQQRGRSSLFDYAWHRIILDEAHTIKGKGNYCARGAYSLEAKTRWCLTGTPIHNCFDDLYSLVNFLKCDIFQDYYWWNKHVNNCSNQTEVFRLLQTILEPILLRRTKKTKYADGTGIISIPKKSHKMLVIPFSSQEKKLYGILERRSKKLLSKILVDKQKFSAHYFHVFSIMAKLRSICDHPLLLLEKLDNRVIRENVAKLEEDVLAAEKSKGNAGKLESLAYKRFLFELVQGVMKNNDNQEYQQEVFKKITKKQMDDECYCMEPFTSEVSMLTCGHLFHQQCIYDLLSAAAQNRAVQSSPICPICRVQFTQKSITVLKFSEIKEKSKAKKKEDQDRLTAHIEEKKEQIQALKLLSPSQSSKLTVILQEITKVHEANEKVIVYSQFLGFLSLLQKSLDKRDIQFTRLDGSMNRKDRTNAIRQFSEDRKVNVILISLKAGAFGLNLTAATNVFICDPWYNPAVEEQAIERCHRIGQTRKVNVIHFIMEFSIEQRILECQQRKRNLIMNTLQNKHEKREKEQEEKIKQISFILGFNGEEDRDISRMSQMRESTNGDNIDNYGDEMNENDDSDEDEVQGSKGTYEVELS